MCNRSSWLQVPVSDFFGNVMQTSLAPEVDMVSGGGVARNTQLPTINSNFYSSTTNYTVYIPSPLLTTSFIASGMQYLTSYD